MEKLHTILIVDDDEVLRQSLSMILERSYRVLSAGSASHAMELIQRTDNFPDIALLDLMMPGVDGLALLELMRQRFSNLPIIMLTASESVSSVVKAMKIGANDYLVKPFEVEELLFRLAEVLSVNTNSKPEQAKDFVELSKNFEREKIVEALKQNDYIQTRAAKELGITRRMLKYRMDKLGIS